MRFLTLISTPVFSRLLWCAPPLLPPKPPTPSFFFSAFSQKPFYAPNKAPLVQYVSPPLSLFSLPPHLPCHNPTFFPLPFPLGVCVSRSFSFKASPGNCFATDAVVHRTGVLLLRFFCFSVLPLVMSFSHLPRRITDSASHQFCRFNES